MKNTYKFNPGRLALVLGVLLVAFCPLNGLAMRGALAESVRVGPIKAMVNDAIITEEEVVKRSAPAIREAMEKYKGSALMEKAEQVRTEVLDELIDRQLLIQEAQKLIKDNPIIEESLNKELDIFMKEAIDEVGSLSKFYELATKEGINPQEKRKELKEDMMADALLKEFAYKKIAISPKDVRNYYLKNQEEFNEEKEVRVRRILIKVLPDAKETERKAQEVYQRAKDGEDFLELVRQFSQEPRASSGGLFEHKEIKQWIKELKDPVMALEQREISQPIMSPIGFFIFKAEEVKPGRNPSFEEVQDKIYVKLRKEEERRRKKAYLKGLKEKAVIKITR
jgi:parvulin-like peptidyl-prolyl isomerase